MKKQIAELEKWFEDWYEYSWNSKDAKRAEELMEVKKIIKRIKKRNSIISSFLQGLIKLPIHNINGKEYVLTEDVEKLFNKTFLM